MCSLFRVQYSEIFVFENTASRQYLPPKDDNDPVTLTQTRTHVSLGSIVGNFQKDQKIFRNFSKVKHHKL